MGKVDLHRQFAREYKAGGEPRLVKVSRALYLAIDGSGAPGSAAFNRRLSCLYQVAYSIRSEQKKIGRDYVVGRLEALWWVESGEEFERTPAQAWRYTLMIRTPDFITEKLRKDAMESLIGRGKPGEVVEVRLLKLAEGLCVQALHIGPYDAERLTLAKMKQLAREERLRPRLKHHEIYLSDPRRVTPDKLRTIIRQPIG